MEGGGVLITCAPPPGGAEAALQVPDVTQDVVQDLTLVGGGNKRGGGVIGSKTPLRTPPLPPSIPECGAPPPCGAMEPSGPDPAAWRANGGGGGWGGGTVWGGG